MPAIDEHDQLDFLRTAEIDQRVERGANRAPRIQHVVHEQDFLIVDRERNLRAAHQRLGPDGMPHHVIAVQRDVERPGPQRLVRDLLEHPGETLGEHVAARADADQREVLGAAVALENFVRDARQRASHAVGVHDDGHQEPAFARLKSPSFGAAGQDVGLDGEKSARRAVRVFMALVGLAGPLLKRWCKYTVTTDLLIY